MDKERSQSYNTLSQRKMADLLYVHYNLRLRERQLRKRSNESISLDHILTEHLLDEWIVEPQKQGMQEDEVCGHTGFTCEEIPIYASNNKLCFCFNELHSTNVM